jgi:hypothetical protein
VRDFVARATSPIAWISHAEWLVGSTEVLWQRISGHFDNSTSRTGTPEGRDATHGPAFLLLVGFGLEAMLKAAALQVELNAGGINRVLVATPTPRVQTWLKTHRLESLANRAGATVWVAPRETLSRCFSGTDERSASINGNASRGSDHPSERHRARSTSWKARSIDSSSSWLSGA